MLPGGGYKREQLASLSNFSRLRAKNKTYAIIAATFVAVLFSALVSLVPSAMPFSGQLGLDVPSASAATQLSFTLSQAIAVRVLDSTATSEITNLSYNISPSPSGFTTRNSAVVDVATSNETGYSLSMTSDYRIDGTSSDPSAPNYSATSTAAYTTALVPSPASGISVNIPTSISATKNYWNYGTSWNEDLEDALNNTTNYTGGTSTNKVIPAHTTSDTIRSDVDVPTDSSKTTINIDVNASEDIPTGTYNNRLVFTAVGNPIPADYTLTYDKNTTDTVSNLPSPSTWSGVASSHTFTIPDTSGEGTLPAMTRDGYKLVGWSTSATERQGSGSGPDGLYVAGDTYTVNATSRVYPAHDTGEATLYAFWEVAFSCVANQICYNSNGADVVGTMENQTTVYMTSSTSAGSTDDAALSGSTTEFTLYSPNFSRTGYGFAGWNTKADGTGTMFGPNQTLTTSDSTLTSAMQSSLGSKGLIFYAIWVPSAGNLQTWTGCSSLTSGQVTALTDSRDSQTYAVAKLADDKCWTIENMRYKPTAGTETTSFSISNPGTQQYSLTNIDRTLDPLAVSNQGSPYYQWYSYGGQYSWLSSINTTTNGSSNYSNWNTATSSYTTTGTTMAARTATDAVKNANICPAGWRLPRSAYSGSTTNATANNDFPYLNNALNSSYSSVSTFEASNNWRKYPNNFVFAGRWDGANAFYRGTYGLYWSSSVYDSSRAYYLRFYSTYVSPANNYYKRVGYSVRCVYSF